MRVKTGTFVDWLYQQQDWPMIVRENQTPWQYDYKFGLNDCDARGNVFYSSTFRVAELAREQFLSERVKGYSALLENGLQVLLADAQFEFHTEFLPFDKVTCIVTATEVIETEAALRFQFRQCESNQSHAESRQIIRFADANRCPIFVPGSIRQALTAVLEAPDRVRKPLISAG